MSLYIPYSFIWLAWND